MTLTTPLKFQEQEYGPNRSAPHSIEAEEAVLGCVLINADAYNEVAAFLTPTDFYLHKNRWIWDAFVSLQDQHLPIDVITVSNELERHSQLADVGGLPYLTKLINAVPTSLHVEAYARLVEREAVRRRLIEAATEIAKLAYTEDRPIDEVVNEAGTAILGVRRESGRHPEPIKDLVSLYYDKLKAMADDPSLRFGLLSGLLDEDAMTGGMYNGEFIVVAGRPGAGKTAYMLSTGKYIASPFDVNHQPKEPKKVAIFSMEMPRDQLVMRLMAHEASVEIRKLRQGEVADEEWPVLIQACGDLGEYNLFIDDEPALTPTRLRAKCQRLMLEYGLDLVIVDYLQLMQADRRSENRTQEVSSVSRDLKKLALELNIPIVAGAQLNRAVEYRADKKPMLADLRDSGGIEQDADTVKFLWAEDGSRGAVNETIGKQRNGMTGDLVLYFRKPYGRFENAEVHHVDLAQV